MDLSFPNGPVYAPAQPPARNQSLSASSNRTQLSVPYRPYPTSPHATSQQAPQISQVLPSIPRAEYDGNESLAFRNLAPQSPMIRSSLFNGAQAESYQPYAPSSLPQANGSNAAYPQHQQPFPTSQAYISQTSGSQAYQPYVSPHPNSGRLPDIRPMPNGGLNGPSPLASPRGPSSSLTSLSLHTGQKSQPTHVVGSQGRRGILPSAVGRPTAFPIGNASCQKTSTIPAKDVDGKFPCPHCAKTYLHAKHLKRHLLRHTGTRPYSCGLCKDTFSRSDILKRHFQKCSVRRGNPTGENHLSHSRATKKSNLEKALRAPVAPISQPERNRPISSTPTTAVPDFTKANLPNLLNFGSLGISTNDFSEDNHNLFNREPRPEGAKRLSNGGLVGNSVNFRSPSSSSYDSGNFSYSGGHVTPESITTSGAATPYHYSNEPRTNHFPPDTSFGRPIQGQGAHLAGNSRTSTGSGYPGESLPQIVASSNGRGTGYDWPPVFPVNGSEDYSNTQFHSNLDNCQQPVKSEPDFSDMSFALQQEYPPYLPTKV